MLCKQEGLDLQPPSVRPGGKSFAAIRASGFLKPCVRSGARWKGIDATTPKSYNNNVIITVFRVLYHPEAEAELDRLPAPERVAVLHAVDKLAALGLGLRYPRQSEVRGSGGLRELRPRAGRSPWRAFYRQFGRAFVIGAVGPEAQVDNRGFRRAVGVANERLSDIKREGAQGEV
jgi:hypothetical protein